jgi:hypothetical protein
MAPPYHTGPTASASSLDGVQQSFLMGWVFGCCSPTASSSEMLISSAMVLLRARLPELKTDC